MHDKYKGDSYCFTPGRAAHTNLTVQCMQCSMQFKQGNVSHIEDGAYLFGINTNDSAIFDMDFIFRRV